MHPILKDFPESIETQRLLIRAPKAGDGSAVFEAVLESLASLRQWPVSLPWAQYEPSVEASEIFCREGHSAYLARKDMPMLMFLKDTGTFAGSCGLHRIDWSVPKFEVGYWCRTSLQRQGLTSEAVKGLNQFAFDVLGARRITSLTDAENQPSRRVLERTGFSLEGIMHNDRITHEGVLRSTCLYAIVP